MEHGRGYWNPTFVKPFSNWEMEHVDRLLFMLWKKKVNEGMEDFGGGRGGGAAIKSMYKALEQRSSSSFPWKSIWKKWCATKKLCFFRVGSNLGKDSYFRASVEKGLGHCK